MRRQRWFVLEGPNGVLLPGKENGLLDGIGRRVSGPFSTRREAKEAIAWFEREADRPDDEDV
jgi:hypothetical protein